MMLAIYSIRYTPESADELQAAIDNLNKFSPGSGNRFFARI